MSHERDGNKGADPGASASMPFKRWTRPSSLDHPDAPNLSPNATGSPSAAGEEGLARQDRTPAREHVSYASPCGHAAPARQAGRTGRLKELAKSIARGADQSPSIFGPSAAPQCAASAEAAPVRSMFNAENQPGFKTHERKTKLTGKFALAAVPPWMWKPLGGYQDDRLPRHR